MSTPGYKIITDSSANLPDNLIRDWQLGILSLELIVDDASYKAYDPDSPTDKKKYYDMMREGKVIKTTMASVSDAEQMLRECFDNGQDAIYIGFCSNLSATFEIISAFLERLRDQHYPERRLRCVDTLAADMGEGLIVAEAVKLRDSGMGLDELADWVLENRLDFAHWFTVDDLKYLQRGGRLTAGAAFAGTLLNIKPVLHVDDEGRLVPVEKLRGRKRTINYLADRVAQDLVEPFDEQSIFISHGDCYDECVALMNLISESCPGVAFVTNDLDPVIGAHAGPGTIAVFFRSKNGRG